MNLWGAIKERWANFRARLRRLRLATALIALLLLLYSGWVITGFVKLTKPQSEAEATYVTARTLVAGHRIQAEDMTVAAAGADAAKLENALPLDSLSGRYLLHPVDAGVPLRDADAAVKPALRPAAGKIVYFASLETHGHLLPFIDAGSSLTLCRLHAVCIPHARVLAVLCDGEGGKCQAATEIPGENAAQAAAPAELQIFLE